MAVTLLPSLGLLLLHNFRWKDSTKKASFCKYDADDFKCIFLKIFKSALDFICDQITTNQPQLSKIYSYFIWKRTRYHTGLLLSKNVTSLDITCFFCHFTPKRGLYIIELIILQTIANWCFEHLPASSFLFLLSIKWEQLRSVWTTLPLVRPTSFCSALVVLLPSGILNLVKFQFTIYTGILNLIIFKSQYLPTQFCFLFLAKNNLSEYIPSI